MSEELRKKYLFWTTDRLLERIGELESDNRLLNHKLDVVARKLSRRPAPGEELREAVEAVEGFDPMAGNQDKVDRYWRDHVLPRVRRLFKSLRPEPKPEAKPTPFDPCPRREGSHFLTPENRCASCGVEMVGYPVPVPAEAKESAAHVTGKRCFCSNLLPVHDVGEHYGKAPSPAVAEEAGKEKDDGR